MTAKEFAEKYAGKVVKCNLNKSMPIDGGNGHYTMAFDARVIGWKDATGVDPQFVAVEVLPPAKTKYLVTHFKAGYHWTYKAAPGSYAKKVLVEEIITPSSASATSKHISEWPHVCRDCGSPAQMFATKIDCSNAKCKHKYKTSSGMDLFLPKEMQIALSKPKNMKPARKNIDAEGFMICGWQGKCTSRIVSATAGSKGHWVCRCPNAHSTLPKPQQGDKVDFGVGPYAFDGKMTFVPVKK